MPLPFERNTMMSTDDGPADAVDVNPFWCVAGAMRLVSIPLTGLDYSGNRTATHQPLTCWM